MAKRICYCSVLVSTHKCQYSLEFSARWVRDSQPDTRDLKCLLVFTDVLVPLDGTREAGALFGEQAKYWSGHRWWINLTPPKNRREAPHLQCSNSWGGLQCGKFLLQWSWTRETSHGEPLRLDYRSFSKRVLLLLSLLICIDMVKTTIWMSMPTMKVMGYQRNWWGFFSVNDFLHNIEAVTNFRALSEFLQINHLSIKWTWWWYVGSPTLLMLVRRRLSACWNCEIETVCGKYYFDIRVTRRSSYLVWMLSRIHLHCNCCQHKHLCRIMISV